jgi:hypothetical protein
MMRDNSQVVDEWETHTRKLLTTSFLKANGFALLLTLPVLLIFGIPYYVLWGDTLIEGLNQISFSTHSLMLLLMLLAGIVLHELIHGVVWARYCRNGFKSIRFGVKWSSLSPYCHCTEALTIHQYKTATAMPGIILGFAPSLFGILTGHLGALLFGLLFTLAAGGDFLMLWLLRHEPQDSLILDHPSEIGCFIYEPKR